MIIRMKMAGHPKDNQSSNKINHQPKILPRSNLTKIHLRKVRTIRNSRQQMGNKILHLRMPEILE